MIKRPVIVIFRPQIVSRRKDMTGIETDAQPFRIFRFIDNLTQMLKAVSQIRPLSRCCFQQDNNVSARRLLEECI